MKTVYKVYEINRHFGMPFYRASFSSRKDAKEYVRQMSVGHTGKFKIETVKSNPRRAPRSHLAKRGKRPASPRLRRTRARKNPRKRQKKGLFGYGPDGKVIEAYALAHRPKYRSDRPRILKKRMKRLGATKIKRINRNPYRAYIVYAGEKQRGRGSKVKKWYWNGHALTLSKKYAETFPNATTAHNVGKRIRGRILNSNLRNRFSCVGITEALGKTQSVTRNPRGGMFLEYNWTANNYMPRFGDTPTSVDGYRSFKDLTEARYVLRGRGLKLGKKTDSRTWRIENA